jgi:hypothetical protein
MGGLRYSHHRHTGRLRPHHETSYALLFMVALCLGVGLAGCSVATQAATEGQGGYDVKAVVAGARPTGQAIITNPTTGQTFETNPITVEGTCPDRTMVKIFKNGVLAGSVICDPNRRFSLQIDLVVGKNDLTALAFNNQDQAGPDSPVVTVTLNVPAGGPGFSTELILHSINYYRGAKPGQEVVWPVELIGGQAPYAVLFDWGDGTSDLTTRTAAGSFELKHVYTKPGGYLGAFPLIIRATDAAGHTAYLQLTTIINESAAASQPATTPPQWGSMLLAWPLWVALVLMIVMFWLGEWREKRKLMARMRTVT